MYYQLRVTPVNFKCPFGLASKVCEMLIKRPNFDSTMYIFADESMNKNGVATERHFHFNFVCDEKKDTLQNNIRKWFADRGYACKGNKSYALSNVDEPDDYHRWVRYLMKEKWVPELSNLQDFTPEEIKNMEMLAKDERIRQVKKNVEYHEKQQQKEILFDKIMKHLDNLKEKDLKTFRDINIEIARFYKTEKKPINVKTIDGYTYTYMLTSGLISHDEFFDNTHR